MSKRISFLLAVVLSLLTLVSVSTSEAFDLEAFDAKEVEQIRKFTPDVKRDGDTLYLRLKSGSYSALTNSNECSSWDTCTVYWFVDYFEDVGLYFVFIGYYEGAEYLMVFDKSGKEYLAPALPRISLDGKRVVAVSADETGYGANGVFVWRLEDEKLVSELSYEPEEYALYEFVAWEDNNTVRLTKFERSREGLCPENGFMTVPVIMKFEKEGWGFYDDLSAAVCGDIQGALAKKEYEQLRKFSEYVEKKDNDLQLLLKDGSYKTLPFIYGCQGLEPCGPYRFLDYSMDAGFYLTSIGYDVPYEYVMVSDKTGKEYRVHFSPEIAPDRKRVIALPTGEGMRWNGVFIWRFEEDRLVSELSYKPGEYAVYKFVKWKDSNTVLLSKFTRSDVSFCPKAYYYMTVPVTLELYKGRWEFHEDLSAEAVECDAE
ncbi:MAG: hypothetical protein V3W31_07905 [Thermodesulfobacteriota bacterium]